MFFTILDRRKNAKICYINKKERKIGCCMDTEEHRLIMATRCKLSRFSLHLTRDLFFLWTHTRTHDVDNLKLVFMLNLMAMSFYSLVGFDRSILYLFTLFVYLSIFIFSPKRRYILCNKKFYFFIDWNISETWTRIKLKQLSKMLLGSFSEKKCIVLKGKKLFNDLQFFSKTTVSFYPCFLGKYIQNCMWYSRLTKMQK